MAILFCKVTYYYIYAHARIANQKQIKTGYHKNTECFSARIPNDMPQE